MSDEIERGTGAYFASGTPAWHGYGLTLTDAPSVDEAKKIVTYKDGKELMLFKVPCTYALSDTEHGLMPEHAAIVRSDGQPISVVGCDYELRQYGDVFETFRPLWESGLVEMESGFIMRNGKRIAVLAKVKNGVGTVIGDDEIKAYVLAAGGVDVSENLTRTNVRVVCANTLAQAQGYTGEKAEFRFRHTKNIHNKIREATDTIAQVLAGFKGDLEAYRAIARKHMNGTQMEAYVRKVMLTTEQQISLSKGEELPTRTLNKVQRVISLIDAQKVPVQARGTAWQAYNAVTQYLTHEQGRTIETRVDSQWYGESARMNKEALSLALAA